MNVIETDQAPEAVGAYSQGIVANGMIYTSGQIGLDQETGEMANLNFREEAGKTLHNLLAVIKAGGGSAETVVKTTVFLDDLENYPALNEVYQEFFHENLPARSAIEVSSLPKNARLEIEAIATHL